MIKSYWLRLSLFAGAGLFLALVVSFLSPKKYEAIVQILIDQKPLSPMPPMSASQETVHDLLDASRGRSITTQVEQLISYRVLQFAAEMVARDRGIQITTDSELHPTNLRNAILIAAETMSDQITLSVRMSDPELAKDVANGIYLGFRELNESNAMQLGASAVAALKNQYERIDKDLQEVDRQIQALREETNTPSVDTRISADVGNLSKLKENRDQSEIELNAARARVAALEQEVRKQEDRVYSGNTDVINPAVQRYEQEIAILKSNREALMERYLPDHERVLAVDSQIRALQDELRAASREIRNSTATQANPNLIQLKGDLSQARALYQGLSSRVASANAEVAVLESELRGLPLVQARMQELARRQLSLERNRMDVAAQLEIREAAQRGRAAPVQLVTPPTAMPEPVSPKHTINALFGLVAGLILGVLSMLSTEGKRQPVRSLAQLNGLAFHPVYRIIPELRQPFRGVGKAPAESYETLLVNFRRSDKRPYRIGVVGIAKDSGASTTALNLALAAERHGHSSVVVEADQRHPIRRIAFRQGAQSTGDLTKVSEHVTLVSPDGLNTAEVPAEVQKLERDLTIFDFEPTTISAEYAFAASNLDEIIVLVRASRVASVDFLRAQQALADSGCPLVTVVLARTSDLEVLPDAVEAREAPKALLH